MLHNTSHPFVHRVSLCIVSLVRHLGARAVEDAAAAAGVHAIPRPADKRADDPLERTKEDVEAVVPEVRPTRGRDVDCHPHGDGDDGEGQHLRELWLCGRGSGGRGEGTDFAGEGEGHREDEGGEEEGGVG